jgi:hypothetical protein
VILCVAIQLGPKPVVSLDEGTCGVSIEQILHFSGHAKTHSRGRGSMPKYTMIILTSPVEGFEDEYNRWYNDIHLPEVLATEGFVAAQRFKLVGGPDAPAPYLAIYEIESDDFATTFKTLELRVAEGQIGISSTLDVSSAIGAGYEPITERIIA